MPCPHNEILLPANAPRSYADRNTLWNAAEAVEKQWNSQLARRWVLTIPREIPPDQYAVLVREFCQQQFVSKGMIVDFAIHDPHPPRHKLADDNVYRKLQGHWMIEMSEMMATAALSPSWFTRSKPRFTFWKTKLLPEPISGRCGRKRWSFIKAAGSSWLSALPCSAISKNTSGILCRRTPKPG